MYRRSWTISDIGGLNSGSGCKIIRKQVGLFMDEDISARNRQKEREIKGDQSTLYYKTIKLAVDQQEIKKAYDPKILMTLGLSVHVHFFNEILFKR